MIPIRKIDEELQIVYGEVHAPGVIDSQGDFMSEEAIRKMAHRFMINMNLRNVDAMHTRKAEEAAVVESFIVREGDPDFPMPGAWAVGIYVADPELWDQVKKGDYNGFSLDGKGMRETVEVEIEVPESVKGRTDVTDDHDHEFVVKFDENGDFVGGKTVPDKTGHVHKITRGTATNEADDGHSHRFSYVEDLPHVQA